MMRDAARTKARILDAACRILARDGFAGLGVNALAAEAGVGKPLVYRYFGNMAGVAAALVAQPGAEAGGGEGAALPCANAEEALDALIRYGRGLAGERRRRDLIAWSLAVPGGPALAPAGEAEAPTPPATGPDNEAIVAILQAAIAFLLLRRDRQASWAGLPLKEPRHMARLERAVAQLVTTTLKESDVTKR